MDDEITILWNELKQSAKKKSYTAKEWLVHEGDVCKHIYFIEEGIVRSWFNDDGRDISFQFFMKNSFVSSFESLKLNKPCLFNIETITPCVLYVLHRDDFFKTVQANQMLKDTINELLLRRFYHYQKLFLSRIKNNPQNRYDELVKESPELFERIPHHYIASYLGITPVSLSRIRNRSGVNKR